MMGVKAGLVKPEGLPYRPRYNNTDLCQSDLPNMMILELCLVCHCE